MVNYEVELNATYSDDRLLFISTGDVGKHTVTLRSPNIRMNELYNCSVGIEGLSNSQSMRMDLSKLCYYYATGSSYMNYLHIQGTFDVQYVDTTIHNQLPGYIDINCHFAEGSNANGCRITAITQQEYNNSTPCEFVVYREEEDKATVTVTLPHENYTLLVHDYEAEAVDNPAFTTTLSLQSSAQVSGIVDIGVYKV